MSRFKIIYTIALALFIISCDDDDSPSNSIISFSEQPTSVNEGSGAFTVSLELNQPTTQQSQISYSLGGSAGLNGHYTTSSTSPLTLPVGATSAELSFSTIDDTIFEFFDVVVENNEATLVPVDGKSLQIQLLSATGGVVVSDDPLLNTFELEITDNDELPETGMKWDLTWQVVEEADIDLIDLNMVAIFDVVIENNAIIDATTFDASTNASGFESLIIGEDAPDATYFLLIEYFEGSGTADYVFTAFPSGDPSIFIGSFTEEEAQNGLVQILEVSVKEGSNFGRQDASVEINNLGFFDKGNFTY